MHSETSSGPDGKNNFQSRPIQIANIRLSNILLNSSLPTQTAAAHPGLGLVSTSASAGTWAWALRFGCTIASSCKEISSASSGALSSDQGLAMPSCLCITEQIPSAESLEIKHKSCYKLPEANRYFCQQAHCQ